MQLRPYQQSAIDALFAWFNDNPTGNPCLVLPTGAGKSHIVAYFCKTVVQAWPDQKILMLTHVKELIEQNAEKMLQHWPNAPLGIYSAGLRQKTVSNITFGGIQSLRKKSAMLGHVDLIVVDECHLISHKAQGGYRELIAALLELNPKLRVIGLTATPFRLGHGYIHEGDDVIFNDLIEPVLIEDLINDGYLSPLRSKLTVTRLLTDGVHKRGGDYIESELQAAVNTPELNQGVVGEIVRYGQDRKSWLLFCAGVEHATEIHAELLQNGVSAAIVTGDTPSSQRAEILQQFKAGIVKAVVNVSVLTTGFDAPNIDLIALLRPTESPALYMQMVGRGLRLKEHGGDCIVLDFAGNVSRHGAITSVIAPDQKNPSPRICPECDEILSPKAKQCSACGFELPPPEPRDVQEREKPNLRLHQDDIMGGLQSLDVTQVGWSVHTSKTTGMQMLKCRYYGGLSDSPVDQYFGVYGYDEKPFYRKKSRQMIDAYLKLSGITWDWDASTDADLEDLAYTLRSANRQPMAVEYKRNGKFFNVVNLIWS